LNTDPINESNRHFGFQLPIEMLQSRNDNFIKKNRNCQNLLNYFVLYKHKLIQLVIAAYCLSYAVFFSLI